MIVRNIWDIDLKFISFGISIDAIKVSFKKYSILWIQKIRIKLMAHIFLFALLNVWYYLRASYKQNQVSSSSCFWTNDKWAGSLFTALYSNANENEFLNEKTKTKTKIDMELNMNYKYCLCRINECVNMIIEWLMNISIHIKLTEKY